MKATYARTPIAAGMLDLLHVEELHDRFAPHMHEAYAFGVFVTGSYRLRCSGVEYLTGPGTVVTLSPGQIHSGTPMGSTGWTTRMFYPDEALLRDLLEIDRADWTASFEQPLVDDAELARPLTRAHTLLMDGPSLEGEELLVDTFATLIRKYGVASARRQLPVAAASPGMHAVIEYIHENVATRIRLSTLAALAGVSSYHLIRLFGRHFGVSPYAYVKQLRVVRAQRLLRSGMRATEVAFAVGFSDQSHLNRAFKGMLGVTPGAFARETRRAVRCRSTAVPS